MASKQYRHRLKKDRGMKKIVLITGLATDKTRLVRDKLLIGDTRGLNEKFGWHHPTGFRDLDREAVESNLDALHLNNRNARFSRHQ
jgi:GDP-D-mannose dehydratase